MIGTGAAAPERSAKSLAFQGVPGSALLTVSQAVTRLPVAAWHSVLKMALSIPESILWFLRHHLVLSKWT